MGKSSERSAEEISAGKSYDMEAIDEFRLGKVDANSAGVASDLPSDSLFNAYFLTTQHHIQVESDGKMQSLDRNWEIYSAMPSGDTSNAVSLDPVTLSGGNAVLRCTLTDALLTIQTFGPEITQEVADMFSSPRFDKRLNALYSKSHASQDQSTKDGTNKESTRDSSQSKDQHDVGNLESDTAQRNDITSPKANESGTSSLSDRSFHSPDIDVSRINASQWRSEFPSNAWAMMTRIVTDSILTDPINRRSISANALKPSVLLDLHVLLPFLGFTYDEESQLFRPPTSGSSTFVAKLRRISLECRLESSGGRASVPVLPHVARFLGCSSDFTQHVTAIDVSSRSSGPEYACLGCVDTFSDETIYDRYQLLANGTADSGRSPGGPWYFEASKTIAQERNSETMAMHYMELMSLGTQSISSIRTSSKTIGLNEISQSNLSDDELAELMLKLPPKEVAPVASALSAIRPVSQGSQRISASGDVDVNRALQYFAIDNQQHGLQECTSEENPDASHDMTEQFFTENVRGDKSTEAQITDIVIRFGELWHHGTAIDRLEARSALLLLALTSRDPHLLAIYEECQQARSAATSAVRDLPTALELLGLPSTMQNHDFSDEDSIAIFCANAEDASETELFELRRAVRIIAEARGSDALKRFLGVADLDSAKRRDDSDRDEFDFDNYDQFNFDAEKNYGIGTPQSLTGASPPSSRLPVGLWNTGNTCYLNSSSQFYYSLPQVRDYVKDFNPHPEHVESRSTEIVQSQPLASANEVTEVDDHEENRNEEVGDNDATINSENKESISASASDSNASAVTDLGEKKKKHNDEEPDIKKKIGGRVVPAKEIRRSENFVGQLGKLFREIASARSMHVTPSELLAYMALVPPQEDADEQTALEARLAGALQRQQDVTECIENVLYQLEATMKPTGLDEDGEQHDLIKDSFYGTTKQTLMRISDGGNKRTKTERFSSLLLDVNDGPTHIYDSLDKYFADEMLEIEGDGPTLRTLRISQLPQISQIQVQRVQFDTNTFLPYKNLNPLIFPEVVYMDRYLDSPEGSVLDERSREVKQWKLDISELQSLEQQVADYKSSIEVCEAWFETQNSLTSAEESTTDDVFDKENDQENEENPVNRDDSESAQTFVEPLSETTVAASKKAKDDLSTQLENTNSELTATKERIEHQFDDSTVHGYRIHSLFIHKGDASYGHYWIYIRDPVTGQFYKYNDESVTAVSDAEVFDFREQNLATPYFSVFTKCND